MRKLMLISGVSLIALTGCAERGPVASPFFREAGSQIDSGYFGNATANNTAIQSGQKSFAVDLANRFNEQVPTTITFDFNSARLDETSMAVLRQQAQWIRQFPEVRFRVFGHTDLVGSNAYNKRLGLRRAQAAVAYLTSLGISRSRLEAVVSFGETRPLVPVQTPERANRRTVTAVSGFVQSHPSVLDGKYAAIVYRDYVESAVATTTLSDSTTGTTE
jgi:outer membrane protein OmpA-like peptidoglycan-associated protein